MYKTIIIHLCILLSCGYAVSAEFSWQEAHAKRTATGDISWQARPYQFEQSNSVRYIDYANGNDQNSGLNKNEAWKHHPWDAQATAQAKSCTGIHQYIFKGGVIYRGQLEIKESGNAQEQIQLCSDPSWGTGLPVLSGAEVITGFQQGQAPKGVPNKNIVWSAAVNFLPRSIWIVDENNTITRLALARLPNWRSTDRDDIKKDWWTWKNTGPGIHHYNESRKVGRMTLNYGNDPDNITPAIAQKLKGAYVWTEYGWVMGTPFPSRVRAVYPKEGGVALGGQWGDNSGSHIVRGCRYYFDDKAEFLDDEFHGEFWFEKQGTNNGTLHIVLPRGMDIKKVRVEAARHEQIIRGENAKHLHMAGLAFQFTNTAWALDAAGGETAAIVLRGSVQDIDIHNCVFSDVAGSALINANKPDDLVTRIDFTDNDILRTDHTGLNIRSGSGIWAQVIGPFGVVHEVNVLRNRFQFTGRRPTRHGQGHCMHIETVRKAHIAGNVLDMCWGAGIFVFGGKKSFSDESVPFTRLLIHQNKVTNALLNNNDWGGIETWQGGPAYVFNNVSGDISGYWNYNYIGSAGKDVRAASFGHAYYLDGAYKNYHFNNIAYGRTNDPQSPLQTCSAFQEIHSYQNTFFNNSAHNFQVATRRQAPKAGRNKFLSNIFSSVHKVFRHADAVVNKEANAHHAGKQGHGFSYDTLAYGNNIFFDFKDMGLFEEDSTEYVTLKDFAAATHNRKTLRSDVGIAASTDPLPQAAQHDFTPSTLADGKGTQTFVPWALYDCVAEWHFYPSAKDARIIDEHWNMPPYYHERKYYHNRPRFPLQPQGGLSHTQAIAGPLEDWCKGAVSLDGKQHYYVCSHDEMMKPISYSFKVMKTDHPQRGKTITRDVSGQAIKNPQVYDSNFLIEVYARLGADGIILEKMDQNNGYALAMQAGNLVFSVKHNGQTQRLLSKQTLNDGDWHHIIVEADREQKTLHYYLDGALQQTASGIGAESLANNSDLYVGGSPQGNYLNGTLDFMRICHGTLADAETSIEELYAWQFNGPQQKDFSGQAPRGAGRDAGAIEGH